MSYFANLIIQCKNTVKVKIFQVIRNMHPLYNLYLCTSSALLVLIALFLHLCFLWMIYAIFNVLGQASYFHVYFIGISWLPSRYHHRTNSPFSSYEWFRHFLLASNLWLSWKNSHNVRALLAFPRISLRRSSDNWLSSWIFFTLFITDLKFIWAFIAYDFSNGKLVVNMKICYKLTCSSWNWFQEACLGNP